MEEALAPEQKSSAVGEDVVRGRAAKEVLVLGDAERLLLGDAERLLRRRRLRAPVAARRVGQRC